MHLGTRLCVPDVDELRKEIMEEAHFSAYKYSSRFYQDVSLFKRYILVEWDEERHCRICVQVSYLSVGEARTSKTLWITAAVDYSRVEMGHDCHGFYKWFASYVKWL